MVALKKYLFKLLSHAIPAIFLKPFHRRNSNAINQNIPTILQTLFNDHGQVPEEELLTEENILQEKVFDIPQPKIVLFNEVEDLQELALATNNPYSDAQILKTGIKLMQNMCNYNKDLRSWYNLPIADQTWIQFKAHFMQTQTLLQKFRGPTMHSSMLNQQANFIASIQDKYQAEKKEYINAVSASKSRILNALEILTPPIIDEVSVIIPNKQPSINRNNNYNTTTTTSSSSATTTKENNNKNNNNNNDK